MEPKVIICKQCGKEAIVKHRKSVLCPICRDTSLKEYQKNYQKIYQPKFRKEYQKNYQKIYQPKYQKEYQRIYQKAYSAAKRNKQADKRTYSRCGVSDENFLNYCRENHHTVEGCLNCICPECLEPIKADDFLIWEKTDDFHEEDYKKGETYATRI